MCQRESGFKQKTKRIFAADKNDDKDDDNNNEDDDSGCSE